jgi:hypothetical protein
MGLFSARNLVLGGLAIAAYAAAKNKRAVSGLLGGPGAPEPYPAPSQTGPAPAPTVSNADVAGPPENTATHVPAPDPLVHDPQGGIDEQAEVEAAAAEAANIGGTPEAYPSEEDPTIAADEAHRPLEEAGEGYSEGQELAEADLADAIDAPPPTGAPAVDVPPPEETPADQKSSAVWRIDEQPTVEADKLDDDTPAGA